MRLLRLPSDILFLVGIIGGVVLTFVVSIVVWFVLGRVDIIGDNRMVINESPEHTVSPATATTPLSLSMGVNDKTVLFGQSAALTGRARELGLGMQLGIEAAFKEVNDAGGVYGRELELISQDDYYEPVAAIANTTSLIDDQGVFALIGAVGTPTSRSAVPVAESKGVPYIAPFTGAGLLRDDDLEYVINLRASYNQETKEMVTRLTEDIGAQRISIIYQDDSYGLAGYHGVVAALDELGMKPASVGVYTRNTLAVKSGLLDVNRAAPQAVIVIGAYEPVAELILWAKHLGITSVFMNISFVGSNALASALGSEGKGVFVTQVVPFPIPTEDSPPVVHSYVKALEAHAPDAVPGFVSLEGYLAGRLAIAGLENCGRDLDRACFLAGLRATTDDLQGFDLLYENEDDNQGSDTVFLTVIDADGNYRSIETLRELVP